METDEHLCKIYRDVLENVKTAFPTVTKQVKALQQTKQQNQCVITCIECRDYEIHTIACSRKCEEIMSLSVVNLTFCFCLCCIQFLWLHSYMLCLYYPKGFGIMQATFPYKNTQPTFQCSSVAKLAPSMPKLGPLAYDHPIHLEAPVPGVRAEKTLHLLVIY